MKYPDEFNDDQYDEELESEEFLERRDAGDMEDVLDYNSNFRESSEDDEELNDFPEDPEDNSDF